MRLRHLAKLAEADLAECTDLVEELEVARLVEVDRDAVRIAHHLFRSALYTRMTEARRAYWHHVVADHLRD